MSLGRFLALVLLCLTCSALPASAQQAGEGESPMQRDAREAAEAAANRQRPPNTELPDPDQIPAPQACQAGVQLCAAYEAYRVAYFERIKTLGEIQVRQYEKQMAYSDWIMFIVLLLIFGGLAFAGAQLWVALRTGKSVQTGEIDAKVGEQLVVKTSAMGISVLTISLVFFYLLLEQVYDIVPATTGAPH